MKLVTQEQAERIIYAWRLAYGEYTIDDQVEQQLLIDAVRGILTEDRIVSELKTNTTYNAPLVKGGY